MNKDSSLKEHIAMHTHINFILQCLSDKTSKCSKKLLNPNYYCNILLNASLLLGTQTIETDSEVLFLLVMYNSLNPLTYNLAISLQFQATRHVSGL